MSVIAFASAKSSPGVTTAVMAMAGSWPQERPVLVVEVDPAGGDVAARFGLSTDPGLVTLAAAGRRELTTETLWHHVQTLPGTRGAQVLVAPPSPEQTQAALSAVRGRLAEVLGRVRDVDVLVDCGRLDPASPAVEIMAGADLAVMMLRPVLAEVHHLQARVEALAGSAPLALVTVGDRPYPPEEVAATVGIEVLGSLAADRRGAAALAGEAPSPGKLARSELLRSAAGLCPVLVARSAARSPAPVPGAGRLAGAER